MRTIKFRAWDNGRKEWLLGYEYSNLGGFSLDGECVLMGEWANVCTSFMFENDNRKRADLKLMQFTGLKDKNEKEIYEGDIVKWVNGKHYWEAIISTLKDSKSNTLYAIETFHNCTSDEFDEIYTYERSNSRMGFRNDVEFLSKEIEIIGNIYENPELLSTPTAVM